MIEVVGSAEAGIELRYDGLPVLRHSRRAPCLFLGKSRVAFSLFKGRFKIADRTRWRRAELIRIEMVDDSKCTLHFEGGEGSFALEAQEAGGNLALIPRGAASAFALNLAATENESIFGCGEHFTKLDLRGERVRIWVEEHIGTIEAIRKVLLLHLGIRARTGPFRAYATYFPQPTFVSSRKYFCHVQCDAYGTLDFRAKDRHVLRFSSHPSRIVIGRGTDYGEVLGKLTALLGRQPPLPDWAYDGMIFGIQDGTEVCRAKVDRLLAAGASVAGIWAQDWEGQRVTYFGKQLRWDYRWDAKLYPGLPEAIAGWKARGVAFLGYVNPYLCDDGELLSEAAAAGYLALGQDGKPYLTKATSFPFGIVDLSNPAAYAWLKGIIAKNLIALGMGGWMADFGEYLPADAVLAGGTGADWHNRWPALWARLNREAIEEASLLGKVFFFSRSGFTGSAAYTTLFWNGDQHVDWSDDYGLGSVVRATLSLAMTGIGICHSDVGGYTTLPKLSRSKELFLRWLEMNAFTPVMRSHEGNRPAANWQFDSDEETVAAVVRWSRLHAALKPYLIAVEREEAEAGLPMMRPLFFHYDEDFGRCADRAYLLGRDLAVYPVLREGAVTEEIVLPRDGWIGLFDGGQHRGGKITVDAPIGKPPVFYRAGSAYAALFESLRE